MNKMIFFLVAFICIVQYGCSTQPAAAEKKPENTFSVNGSVREIKIVPENPSFPDHEGKAEFMSYCAMCHSLKYISMQPNFPRKTWESEVNKMITKYMAPIDSVTGKKIVDYIVAVKTKG
jgi:hypothetical protein